MTERHGFEVRFCDMTAALCWLAELVLLVAETGLGRRALTPWSTCVAAVAAVLTAIAWMSRRFEALEREAFNRGLRAGMGMEGVAPVEELPRHR